MYIGFFLMKHFFLLTLFVFFPVFTMAQTSLQSLEWILGEWQHIQGEMVFTEQWQMSPDSSLYIGTGKAQKNDKIVSQEDMRIEMLNGELHYIVTVHNHNENSAIPFRLTSSTNNSVIFENPDHDFPQKIEYTFKNNNSIHAVVSATLNEKIRKLDFHFIRKTSQK